METLIQNFCELLDLESFDLLPKKYQKFFYTNSKYILKGGIGDKNMSKLIVRLVEKNLIKYKCNKILGKCGKIQIKPGEYFREGEYYFTKNCNKYCSGMLDGRMNLSELVGQYTDLSKVSAVTGKTYTVIKPIDFTTLKRVLRGKTKEEQKLIRQRIKTLIISSKEFIKILNKPGLLLGKFPNVKSLIITKYIRSNDIKFNLLPQITNLIFIGSNFDQTNLPPNLVSLRLGKNNVTSNLQEESRFLIGVRNSYKLTASLSNLPKTLKHLYLNVKELSINKNLFLTNLPPNLETLYIRGLIKDSQTIMAIKQLRNLKTLTINGYMSIDPIDFLPEGMQNLKLVIAVGQPPILLPSSLKNLTYVEGGEARDRERNRGEAKIPEESRYVKFPDNLKVLYLDTTRVISVDFRYYIFPKKLKYLCLQDRNYNKSYHITNLPKEVIIIRNNDNCSKEIERLESIKNSTIFPSDITNLIIDYEQPQMEVINSQFNSDGDSDSDGESDYYFDSDSDVDVDVDYYNGPYSV